MAKLLLVATLSCVGICTAVQAQVDKYKVTAIEKAACQDDAINLCSDAYPDEDRLLVCMRQKKEQLSTICRAVFEAGMKRRHMAL